MNAVTPQSPSLRFMDTDFTVNWLAPRWSEIWPIKLCHKYIPYIVNVIGHKIEMERLQGNHIIPYSMQGCSLCSMFQSLCSFLFLMTRVKELPPLTLESCVRIQPELSSELKDTM